MSKAFADWKGYYRSPIDQETAPLNCFEICKRDDDYSLFIFNSPSRHAEVRAFLIQDADAGRKAEQAFDESWNSSMKLKERQRIRWDHIEKLASRFQLQTDACYQTLLALRQHVEPTP
jgi:hypothetical protein